MRLDEGTGFATVLLLDLDLTARTVTVVNAGHPRPLLVNGSRTFVDAGMERLRSAVDPDRPLGEVLDGLLAHLATGAEPDDVAIVGVRW